MAWLPKVSLANFGDLAGAVNNLGDLAGAVNKLSESVKNIERNFDSALGFEEKTEAKEAERPPSVSEEKDKEVGSVALPTEDKGTPETPSILSRSLETEPAAYTLAQEEIKGGSPEPTAEAGVLPEKHDSHVNSSSEPVEEEGWAHSAIEFGSSPDGEPAADHSPSEAIETNVNGQLVVPDEQQSSAETKQQLASVSSSPVTPGTPVSEAAQIANVSDTPVSLKKDVPFGKSFVSSSQSQEGLGPADGRGPELEVVEEQAQTAAENERAKSFSEGGNGISGGSSADETQDQATKSSANGTAEDLSQSAEELPSDNAQQAELVQVEPVQKEPAEALPPIGALQPEALLSSVSDSMPVVPTSTPSAEPRQPGSEASSILADAHQAAESDVIDLTRGQLSADQDEVHKGGGGSLASEAELAEAQVEEARERKEGGMERDGPPAASLVVEVIDQSAAPPGPGVTKGADVTASVQEEEMAKLKEEYKQMEVAVQAAARQAQTKADELASYMSANDELKGVVQQLKAQLEKAKDQEKKTADAELDALREEYQHRLSAAERKVYALTKERDMLKREQSRKSDTSALLKEKDEIIKQVMAEGEELSKKQAAQELQMKKLRSQIRELEDEKQRLTARLQVEEARVESIRKDKATTEKALQDAVERGQAELATQKEYYAAALTEAKEAQAQAEARADSEAKADLDRRLREAAERERTLVSNVEELRQALSRTEQQAAFREDMLRRDVEDLEKRCQAAEARHEELVARMPDSTRPLLRQIQAMQESANMRVEALTGVERALNGRLQEAEAKAAAAEERERAGNERLTQTLSRMSVMEAQLALLRAEQAQLGRSLEKERARAAENRQEYLAALEAAATQEGRARQLDEELREARARHRRELNEERARREALEQEIEGERAAMAEYEKRVRSEGRAAAEKAVAAAHGAAGQDPPGRSMRRVSSVSSGGSVEESALLSASLHSPSDAAALLGSFQLGHGPPSPYGAAAKGMLSAASLEQLEALLRHKEGELASWTTRVAALEATRDSLAEELVNTTQQCELLRSEAGSLPGMRAELEALRRRHSSALELMGERDEQVEELRADLQDVKQMYREQIDMLVNQIERLSKEVMIKAS